MYTETDDITGLRASTATKTYDVDNKNSLLIDSILSQDETRDIVSMLDSADELKEGRGLPSFFTSTQMGERRPCRPLSPPLSPRMAVEGWDADCRAGNYNSYNNASESNNKTVGRGPEVEDRNRRNISSDCDFIEDDAGKDEAGKLPKTEDTVTGGRALNNLMNSDPDSADPDRIGGEAVGDVDIQDVLGDVQEVNKGWQIGGRAVHEGTDGALNDALDDRQEVNKGQASEIGDREDAGSRGRGDEGEDGGNEDMDSTPDSEHTYVGALEEEDELPIKKSHLRRVEELIGKLDRRSVTTDAKLHELVSSLEYSQQEIDTLKKENADLKMKMGLLEMEDKRTQYQIGSVKDKIDRLETAVKKKNLIFEGLPEQDGKRENVDRTVSALFDQLNLSREVTFEACFTAFRVGPTSGGGLGPYT